MAIVQNVLRPPTQSDMISKNSRLRKRLFLHSCHSSSAYAFPQVGASAPSLYGMMPRAQQRGRRRTWRGTRRVGLAEVREVIEKMLGCGVLASGYITYLRAAPAWQSREVGCPRHLP